MSRKFSLSTAAALALSLCAGPAVAQKMGGVLKFATPSVKPGLDPARTSTGDGYMLNAMIFSKSTARPCSKPPPAVSARYSNPEVDELLTKARSLVNFDERKPLYDRVGEILYHEGPTAVPYFKNYVSAVRKEVKNYKLIPVQYVDLRDTRVER